MDKVELRDERVLLIHLIDGISLRQTFVVANKLGFSDVSDVSLLVKISSRLAKK
jgi:hypothetical protein